MTTWRLEMIPRIFLTMTLLAVGCGGESGLGIGLYQAAKHAEQAGYRLMLTGNDEGSVCFELRKSGA